MLLMFTLVARSVDRLPYPAKQLFTINRAENLPRSCHERISVPLQCDGAREIN
jgi:hypothetical protein